MFMARNIPKNTMSKTKKSKEQIEFEQKWGEVCPKCKLRKGTFMATGKAEGGRSSTCTCDE